MKVSYIVNIQSICNSKIIKNSEWIQQSYLYLSRIPKWKGYSILEKEAYLFKSIRHN